MDLSMLQDVCRRYSDCAEEYYVEPIPKNKADNARVSLNIPASEKIAALIDFTVFGSAKDAMVVTEGGLYWKSASEDAQNLTWGQLQHRTISETNTILSKLIEFGDGVKMDLLGANKLIKNDNHSVVQLLNDLKKMGEGVNSNKQSTTNSDGLDSGLVECEFCKSKIKPEVTYCKQCGIKLRG